MGAVVVRGDKLISTGYNLRERMQSPIAHAEVMAIHRAAKKLGSWRLPDCEIFVTLEPCVMCSSLAGQARLKRVVYGATDAKGGGLLALQTAGLSAATNHELIVEGGVRAFECGELLRAFFRERRKQKQTQKQKQK